MTNTSDSSSGARIRPSGQRARPRRRVALILAAGLLCALQAPGAPPEGLPQPDTTLIAGAVSLPNGGEVLPAPARPIRAGEYLKFSVRYGFISAGDAYLEIPAVKMWKGRPVYQLVARAESNKFFSAFYKVRNRIESFWDTTGFYSRRFYENRREGGYHEENEITFDYKRGEARYTNDGQTIAIPPTSGGAEAPGQRQAPWSGKHERSHLPPSHAATGSSRDRDSVASPCRAADGAGA